MSEDEKAVWRTLVWTVKNSEVEKAVESLPRYCQLIRAEDGETLFEKAAAPHLEKRL